MIYLFNEIGLLTNIENMLHGGKQYIIKRSEENILQNIRTFEEALLYFPIACQSTHDALGQVLEFVIDRIENNSDRGFASVGLASNAGDAETRWRYQ
jgi:uncharacterized protein YlzI (FlbEa/FlbD family)